MAFATDYKWAKVLDSQLLRNDEIPQFGGLATFPVNTVTDALNKTFGRNDITLDVIEKGWLDSKEALQGLGEKIKTLNFVLSPLRTPLHFLTSEQDIQALMEALLEKEGMVIHSDETYVEGFYKFFVLELLSQINGAEFLGDLAIRLGEGELPEAPFYTIQCTLQVGIKKFSGKLLISAPFRRDWKEHFYGKRFYSKERLQKIPVELVMEGGKAQLDLYEWKSAKVGDCVLLDTSSLDVEKGKGKIVLTLNGEPFFRGKLLEEGIKLLEYPVYEEVIKTMDDEENLYGDMEEEEIEEESVEEEEETLLPFEEEEEEELVSQEKKSIPFEKIPIALTVEVGRIGMSLDELMQLTPGNVLDIKVEPERGVDLLVNGKKVGRGELVKLGDALGVRILEL